jgi:hypothetical protein
VVREAVLTDRELTERQKQMLIEIYDSFRRETAMSQTEVAELAEDEASLPPDAAELTWPENLSPAALGAGPRKLAIGRYAAGQDEPDEPDEESGGATVHRFPPPGQSR